MSVFHPPLSVDIAHARSIPSHGDHLRQKSAPKEQGFTHISAHAYEELLAFCQSRVTDPDGARDIVQECFLRILAMERAGTITGERRALLRLLAMHLIVDLRRRESVRLRHEGASADEALRHPMPRHLQPEELCAFSQTTQAYLCVISGLPPRCRQVFFLHAFEELPNGKIAQLMGISLSMVNKHIGRARRACAACRLALDGAAARSQPRTSAC